jgi:hypothetical protein
MKHVAGDEKISRLVVANRIETSSLFIDQCNFEYSALACFRTGMSGSPSFQSERKSFLGVVGFACVS